MSDMKKPKLRDNKHIDASVYQIGQIPRDIVKKIGAGIVFALHTGSKDISGDMWGDIFANAIGGEHLARPVGISDVVTSSVAWSAKTVKQTNPFSTTKVRLISGRNSPDFSYGIEDPHDDIQKTGDAVLGIWNGRVDIALAKFKVVRVIVLIRNNDCSEFVLYEEYLEHFKIDDFIWRENEQNNFEGIEKHSDNKMFTWQPHGSQFTIHSEVPSSAVKFRIKRPPVLTQENALKNIGFDESWIEIL